MKADFAKAWLLALPWPEPWCGHRQASFRVQNLRPLSCFCKYRWRRRPAGCPEWVSAASRASFSDCLRTSPFHRGWVCRSDSEAGLRHGWPPGMWIQRRFPVLHLHLRLVPFAEAWPPCALVAACWFPAAGQAFLNGASRHWPRWQPSAFQRHAVWLFRSSRVSRPCFRAWK